jgi:hypothetical protein
MKNYLLYGLIFLTIHKLYATDSCLVACYPFSGNANNTLETGFDGVVSGAILSSDRFGNPNQAYQFDGIDDHIVLGILNSINNTDEYTYSFWCSAKFASTTNMPIRTQPDDGADRMAFSINYVGGSPTRLFFDNGDIFAGGRLSSNSQPYDNLWHHYVFVRSTIGNFKKVYIDGVLFISDVAGDILDNKNRELWLGGGIHETGVNEFHNGKIDDIKIYNCALNHADIALLFNENIICEDITNNITVKDKMDFSVYPNPSDGSFIINSNIENYNIELFDCIGNLVLSQNINEPNHPITLNNTTRGIYIIRIITEDKIYYSKLLIE